MSTTHAKPTTNNNNASPNIQMTPQGFYVSTSFTYVSPTFQNSANTIWQNKVQYESTTNASVTGKTFQFASQQDRIAALIGRFQQAPGT